MKIRYKVVPLGIMLDRTKRFKVRPATPKQIRKVAGLSKKDQARVDKLVATLLKKKK